MCTRSQCPIWAWWHYSLIPLALHHTQAKRLLQYVGAEVALGGWIVTFMNRIRLASAYNSGIAATGFWAGMTVGRAGLGFVTDKFGERVCVIVYLALSLGLELLFWFVPNFIVGAVAVAFLGMFLGPLFPAGIVVSVAIYVPNHYKLTCPYRFVQSSCLSICM